MVIRLPLIFGLLPHMPCKRPHICKGITIKVKTTEDDFDRNSPNSQKYEVDDDTNGRPVAAHHHE
jgi:hypothetical protein